MERRVVSACALALLSCTHRPPAAPAAPPLGAPPATASDYWAMWEAMYRAFLQRQLTDPVLAALNWSAIQARADGTAHPALELLAGQMRQWLEDRPEVSRVYSLLTMQLGSDAMVAVKAEMVPAGGEEALVNAINRVESDFRSKFPITAWLFFEPDHADD